MTSRSWLGFGALAVAALPLLVLLLIMMIGHQNDLSQTVLLDRLGEIRSRLGGAYSMNELAGYLGEADPWGSLLCDYERRFGADQAELLRRAVVGGTPGKSVFGGPCEVNREVGTDLQSGRAASTIPVVWFRSTSCLGYVFVFYADGHANRQDEATFAGLLRG
ncbi:MAG: hypothetical protein FJ288_18735 [Planctomycetes bacterium]|nr:hypothetical protein [Planctomycetota bacterium]